MLFISQLRKRIVWIPLGWLAIAIGAFAAFAHTSGRYAFVFSWVLPIFLLLMAVSTFNVATRVGNRIAVRGVWGRQWFSTQNASLIVINRGRSGLVVNVELIAGTSLGDGVPSTTLASYFGPATDRAAIGGQRIADALGMKAPRLAPWLALPGLDAAGEAEGAGAVDASPVSEADRAAEPEQAIESNPRVDLEATAAARFLAATDQSNGRRNFGLDNLWLILLPAAAIVWGVTATCLDGTKPELYLRCQRSHQIRLPVGEVTLKASTGFKLGPGEVTIEVWNADLACWTARTLTLERGVKTILNVDDLAALNRCDRRGLPPASPDP